MAAPMLPTGTHLTTAYIAKGVAHFLSVKIVAWSDEGELEGMGGVIQYAGLIDLFWVDLAKRSNDGLASVFCYDIAEELGYSLASLYTEGRLDAAAALHAMLQTIVEHEPNVGMQVILESFTYMFNAWVRANP